MQSSLCFKKWFCNKGTASAGPIEAQDVFGLQPLKSDNAAGVPSVLPLTPGNEDRFATTWVPSVSRLRPGRDFSIAILLAALLALTGCGMPGAPQPPSLNLPNRVSNLNAVRTGDQVALTWKMPVRNTDKLLLKESIATRVCRNENATGACNAVTTLQLAPGDEASYADSLPSALASGTPHAITYFVELVNRRNRSAGLSNGSEVLAGQAPAAVEGLAAELRKDGVLLHWSPAPPESQSSAIRFVRTLLTPPIKKPSQGPLSAPPEPTVRNLLVDSGTSGRALDKDIRFGESYEYRAQRVTRVNENGNSLELAGPLCAPVQVDAADIFPPAVPKGLAAVATAGENGNAPAIDLSWQPDSDPNLAGYIVYRQNDSAGWQRISPAQPVIGPGFHDSDVQTGRSYMYAVSAIGQNGHESARSVSAQETVPAP